MLPTEEEKEDATAVLLHVSCVALGPTFEQLISPRDRVLARCLSLKRRQK